MRTLQRDPRASVDDVASASGLGRATVYRHFRTRGELVDVARRQALEDADANESDHLRPAGELAPYGDGPLDVAEVLNKVPPHLLGDQIVAEAQRLIGVTSVALYLIDIDGSHLLRHAGSQEFPARLDAPLAVGPEIPREGVPGLRRMIEELLPGSIAAPMFLRGRAIGLLMAVQAPEGPLKELARQAAAALALATDYTDVFDMTRRRKETSAAAEIQQNLLPPRVARIGAAGLAGNVLPGYDVGGDWFDYVENADGAWIGIADASGKGARAAALGAVTLGAFRAARRTGADIEGAAWAVDEVVRAAAHPDACLTAIIGRWHGPSSMFSWVNCGHPKPCLVAGDGRFEELGGEPAPPLGRFRPGQAVEGHRRRLHEGERLVLYSDGVSDRRDENGVPLGLAGLEAAVARAQTLSAPATVRAIEDAVLAASEEPMGDDATLVVLAPTGPAATA